MTDKKTANLKRLLAPRGIAFIGGADADYAARQCARNFKGPVWGVNPKRDTLGGNPCFPAVADLPEPPDAVFLAAPKPAAPGLMRELNHKGAGGVVCFTAGYAETGEQGRREEAELAAAAGDVVLVGPNCYGLINYVSQGTLWPFGAGDQQCERGIALIMQSGMITADMAMNQRSAPLAYVVSVGNQVDLAIEDFIHVMVDDPAVCGFGLYLEGIRDVNRFAAAAHRALAAEKPILVIKAGSSRIGSRLAVSHTGSLSGSDEAHQAFFDALGVVRVHSPELMLETLKFICISGVPRGRRVAAFTCSGGEALMVADYCERLGLELPRPSDEVFDELTARLPEIATVSNPLDYTTPLWGNTEVMPRVFAAALRDGFDAAVLVQDYPPDGFDADAESYRADGRSFMRAVNDAGIPAAILSELSENFDRRSREDYVAGGVTPLQGFDRGLDALALACRYHAERARILDCGWRFEGAAHQDDGAGAGGEAGEPVMVDEWQAKDRLRQWGVRVPDGVLVAPGEDWNGSAEMDARVDALGFPLAAKLVADELAHKTEAGAVELNIRDREQLGDAVERLRGLAGGMAGPVRGVLVERMVLEPIHELLVGVRRDEQFGLVMVIASGGVLVELYRDARTLLLPTVPELIAHALSQLTCYPLLTGYRGRPACDLDALVDGIHAISRYALSRRERLVEMDINPLLVTADGAVAVDALVREYA